MSTVTIEHMGLQQEVPVDGHETWQDAVKYYFATAMPFVLCEGIVFRYKAPGSDEWVEDTVGIRLGCE